MRIRYGWELALAALLVIEIVAFGAINPRRVDLNMLLFSTSDFICIGIVALPLTMVIVSGGIDISFGSTIGLCAIALGVLFQSGVPMPLAILLTLLLGALCGLINAGLIIYTKVNPLVITLGTLYLFAGSALLLSGMAGATGYEGIGGFPMAFTDFANLTVLGLPVPLILFLFLICFIIPVECSSGKIVIKLRFEQSQADEPVIGVVAGSGTIGDPVFQGYTCRKVVGV